MNEVVASMDPRPRTASLHRGGAVLVPSSDVAPPRRVPPSSPSAAREVLRAHAEQRALGEALVLESRQHWVLLLALSIAVGAAILLASFGTIDVTTTARGVLRASTGIQDLQFAVDGVVSEVLVTNGDHVEAGQELVRLDATELRSELEAAERVLAELELESKRDDAAAEVTQDELELQADKQLAAIERERTQVLARTTLLKRRLDRWSAARARAVLTVEDREQLELEILDEKRHALELEQKASHMRAAAVERRRARQREASTWREKIGAARAARDGARTRLQQAELRAPTAGRIDAIAVRGGQRIRGGEAFATVHPAEPSRHGVVYVPERERAFLRVGARVRLELDQLPVGEFGGIDAEVTRISADIAHADEVTPVLGPDTGSSGPFVRVELRVVDGAESELLYPRLSSGAMFSARIHLRERRILGLLFEPLRRWLDR